MVVVHSKTCSTSFLFLLNINCFHERIPAGIEAYKMYEFGILLQSRRENGACFIKKGTTEQSISGEILTYIYHKCQVKGQEKFH